MRWLCKKTSCSLIVFLGLCGFFFTSPPNSIGAQRGETVSWNLVKSFGHDGVQAFYDNIDPEVRSSVITALEVQPDGKILFGGYADPQYIVSDWGMAPPEGNLQFFHKPRITKMLGRLNPDGSWDESFGIGGKVFFDDITFTIGILETSTNGDIYIVGVQYDDSNNLAEANKSLIFFHLNSDGKNASPPVIQEFATGLEGSDSAKNKRLLVRGGTLQQDDSFLVFVEGYERAHWGSTKTRITAYDCAVHMSPSGEILNKTLFNVANSVGTVGKTIPLLSQPEKMTAVLGLNGGGAAIALTRWQVDSPGKAERVYFLRRFTSTGEIDQAYGTNGDSEKRTLSSFGRISDNANGFALSLYFPAILVELPDDMIAHIANVKAWFNLGQQPTPSALLGTEVAVFENTGYLNSQFGDSGVAQFKYTGESDRPPEEVEALQQLGWMNTKQALYARAAMIENNNIYIYYDGNSFLSLDDGGLIGTINLNGKSLGTARVENTDLIRTVGARPFFTDLVWFQNKKLIRLAVGSSWGDPWGEFTPDAKLYLALAMYSKQINTNNLRKSPLNRGKVDRAFERSEFPAGTYAPSP